MAETCLFHFPAQRLAARALCGAGGLVAGRFSLERFANGELHVELRSEVAGRRCLVLGTIAPPPRNLAAFTLLCHTLARERARSIVALLPYLAYSRHDRKEPHRSFGAAWIGALLEASGVESVVTVDVHSPRVARAFPMPLVSLSSASILADEIRRRSLLDATLVAPDEGAIARCRAVARAAGMPRAVAHMTKTRTRLGVVHGRLHGSVGPRAVIVDDMLDTGGTLISCCARLRQHGVREVYVMVTHGLFTGSAWRKLWKLGVKAIACTDTVPFRPGAGGSVTRLPVSPLLVRAAMKVEPARSRVRSQRGART